jgi:hypothetical protein
MDDPTDTRLPRLAPLLLIGVLAWLAVSAGESAPGFQRVTAMIAVAVVGYAAWRFHGLIAAAVAIAAVWLIDPPGPPPAALLERPADALFLATLGLCLAAASRQGRPGGLPWLLLAVAGAAAAGFGWYRLDGWPTDDAVARDRLRHVTIALSVLVVPVGLAARSVPWTDRFKLAAAVLLPPAVGLLAVGLARGDRPRLLDGGEWSVVGSEWQAAIQNGSWLETIRYWAPEWLVLPLLAVGLWRTVVRGWKGLKAGRPPLAWLVTAAALGAIAAVGARPPAAGSLAVAAVGSVLCVFGVADLGLALVERIELKPPEPGPSAIPRVK